jgi:hypothetical protein
MVCCVMELNLSSSCEGGVIGILEDVMVLICDVHLCLTQYTG